MRNNYSFLKGCISYSLVNVIISKLNIYIYIYPNKQTFHIHLTIKKKSEKITHISLKFKNNNF